MRVASQLPSHDEWRDKKEELLEKLSGNWIYTSDEDMQCYLLSFYMSGKFQYQSQEVSVKTVFAGKFVFSEDFKSITLLPDTTASAISFQLEGFDSSGKLLSLLDNSGRKLVFEKTMLTEMPSHDDWKSLEDLLQEHEGASQFYNVLSQLVPQEELIQAMIRGNYLSRTFEPTVGEASWDDPYTRCVPTNSLATPATTSPSVVTPPR